jgi:hypothetical protein
MAYAGTLILYRILRLTGLALLVLSGWVFIRAIELHQRSFQGFPNGLLDAQSITLIAAAVAIFVLALLLFAAASALEILVDIAANTADAVKGVSALSCAARDKSPESEAPIRRTAPLRSEPSTSSVAPTKTSKVCHRCGKTISVSAKVCEYCGWGQP